MMAKLAVRIMVFSLIFISVSAQAAVVFEEDWSSGWINPVYWQTTEGTNTQLAVEDISGDGSDFALLMWTGPDHEVWTTSVRSRLHFRRGQGLTLTAKLWGDPSRTDGTYTYPHGAAWMLGFFQQHDVATPAYQQPEAVLDDWFVNPTNPRLRLTEAPTNSAFLGAGGTQLTPAFMNAMSAATSKAAAFDVRLTLGDTQGAKFEWYDSGSSGWVTEYDTLGSGTGSQEQLTLGFAPVGAAVFIDDIVVEGTAEFNEDWEAGQIDQYLWNHRNAGNGLLEVRDISGDGSDHALLMWINSGAWSISMKNALGFTRASGAVMEATIWGDPSITDGTNTYPEGMGWLLGFHRDASPGGYVFADNEAVLDHWYTTNYAPAGQPLRLHQPPNGSSFEGGGLTPSASNGFMNALFAATDKANGVRMRITLGETVGARFEWYDASGAGWTVMEDTRGVSGGTAEVVGLGFGPASAAVYIDDISVKGAISLGYADVPDDFPQFVFNGYPRESTLLTEFLWDHFNNRVISGPANKVLFNREYVALSDLWASGMIDTFYGQPSQDLFGDTLLAIGIDDDGYVHTHQHLSHSHEAGWPFPYWVQAGTPLGHTAGWHFQDEGIMTMDILEGWGNPNYYTAVAINGWSMHNITSNGVQEFSPANGYGGNSRWELVADGTDPMLTMPGAPDASLDTTGAEWIWYPEGTPTVDAPVGTRYFRREFSLAAGKTVESAVMLLTADNEFDLFINGKMAGVGRNWQYMTQLELTPHFTSGTYALGLAVTNGGTDPNPAGVIGKLYIRYTDASEQVIVTDANWKAATSESAGWDEVGFNDAAWPAAVELGSYGVAPWSTVSDVFNFNIDSSQAPFLQIRYNRSGSYPQGVQPYIEWMRDDDTSWSSERRVYFEYGNGNSEYELSSGVEHSLIEMFTHPLWEGDIKRLRVNLAPGESGVSFSIDSFFTVYDTRHTTNNTNFILASWEYFRWTGDTEFLAQNMDRMRKALGFLRGELGGAGLLHIRTPWVGHDGRTGVDESSGTTVYSGRGIGENYWDLLPFGGDNMYTTSQYRKVTEVMAKLERAILEHPAWNVPVGEVTPFDPDQLELHARLVAEKAQDTFWNPTTGRFGASINIVDAPTLKDYGFTFVNLESIWYGTAGPGQAESIMSWINGDRIVASDTSQGSDIYRWRLAPRATTLRNLDWYTFAWRPTGFPFGYQIQDGGAVLGFSFFDLWARLKVLGAENAWQRLSEIMAWEEEVRAAGGYRTYYDTHEGTLQGGGTAGGIGIDFEFLETTMVPAIVPLGFLGLDPDAERLNCSPAVPASVGEMTVRNVLYRGVKMDVTVGQDFVTFKLYDTPGSPLLLHFDRWFQLDGTTKVGNDFTLSATGTYHFVRPGAGFPDGGWQEYR